MSDFKKLKASDLSRLEEMFPTVTAQVTAEVVMFCQTPRSAREIMAHIGLSHWKTFQSNYLKPLLEEGAMERTIPNKPKSRLQKYRLTEAARTWLTALHS